MKKTLFAALALLLLSGALKAQDPFDTIHGDIILRMDAMRAARNFERRMLLMPDQTPSQAGYDVIHYSIDIAIDRTAQLVAGRVSILLESLADSLHSIDIDADAVLSIESVSLAGDTALPWARENGVVTVELPAALSAGPAWGLRASAVICGVPLGLTQDTAGRYGRVWDLARTVSSSVTF